ncbi:MAG: stage III sporulation protein AF [Clostridiales bacterium]|nr:stage III sporulation protein AF [Clostridiales bacterium]
MVSQWIAKIVGVAVLGTLADMVIPSGKLKTFTRFFTSLIALLIIIQPIANFLGDFPQHQGIFLFDSFTGELDSSDIYNRSVETRNKEYIKNIYVSKLEMDIAQRIEKYLPEQEFSVFVTVVETAKEDIYALDKIKIALGERKDIKIAPIGIDIGAKDSINEDMAVLVWGGRDFKELKENLSDTYEIDESRIYIVKG